MQEGFLSNTTSYNRTGPLSEKVDSAAIDEANKEATAVIVQLIIPPCRIKIEQMVEMLYVFMYHLWLYTYIYMYVLST